MLDFEFGYEETQQVEGEKAPQKDCDFFLLI